VAGEFYFAFHDNLAPRREMPSMFVTGFRSREKMRDAVKMGM
jgi:hypothetical protein